MGRGSRPKGYLHHGPGGWNPREHTQQLLGAVRHICSENASYLPLTARQIFYMLVGQFGYEKTEQAYARLCNMMVLARRAGELPWGTIRDDGTASHHAGGYRNADQWWRGQLWSARSYERDHSQGQDVRMELWCEAAGMAPQLARVANKYGVDVYSTGGFASVTVTHEIAERALQEEGKPLVFLHVGDYDPSGEGIFDHMAEDVGAFVAGSAYDVEDFWRPERVALTYEQVREHDLPTAPPKRSDSRSARWVGQTCQAEAMPPDLMGETVRLAIEAHVDLAALDQVIAEEKRERAQLVRVVTKQLADNT